MTTAADRRERDGFTMIPDWLVESSAISLHDYVVLIVLMKHARSTGQCHPGFATIAAQARVSRDTVKRSIRSLESRGLISIERRRVGTKNLPNRYTLHVEPSRVGANSTHPEHAPTPSGVDAHSAQVGADGTQGWVLTAPRTRVTNESQGREGKRTASGARRPTKRQAVFIADLRSMLALDDPQPQTFADAHAFIGEHWQEVQRRAHNGEGVECAAADLSPEARRYAREHGLLLDDERTTA
ncbi:helix-turn-helix domain-containing protein [Microbacterium sp. NPDC088796]